MNFAKKLIGNEEERAVSPVIGVILMVAITVILAAVIAAFVMDIGDTSQPVSAAVTVDGDHVTVANADNVDTITATVEEGTCSLSDPATTVGASETHSCGAGDRLVIVGELDTGESQILYDGTPVEN